MSTLFRLQLYIMQSIRINTSSLISKIKFIVILIRELAGTKNTTWMGRFTLFLKIIYLYQN